MSLAEQSVLSDAVSPSSREFLNYCQAEKKRRQSSDDDFDSAGFDEAVDAVLRKLTMLADEGWL